MDFDLKLIFKLASIIKKTLQIFDILTIPEHFL